MAASTGVRCADRRRLLDVKIRRAGVPMVASAGVGSCADRRPLLDDNNPGQYRESLCKGDILHLRMKAGALKYDGLCMSLCGRNPHAPQLSMSKMKAGALTLNSRCRSHCGKNPHVPQNKSQKESSLGIPALSKECTNPHDVKSVSTLTGRHTPSQ